MGQLPSDRAAELALICGMLQGKVMPKLEPSHFTDARLGEIWRAGLAALDDGVDTSIVMLPKYLNTKIVKISEVVNYSDQFGMEVKNMEIYAKSLRSIAARRAALRIADEAANLALEADEPGKPLELMVEKSKQALRDLDKGNVSTTRSEVEDLIYGQEGMFKQSELYSELGARDEKAKANIRQTVKRMVNDGIVEPVKTRGAGWYRLREIEEEPIDFLNASDDSVDLELPFKLNDMFIARPKNIIVVAGEPDAGKTALLLNIARMNMYKHKVRYFSSEMGPNEFRARLKQFAKLDKADPEYTELQEFTRMIPTERSDNFHDVIRPNDINIIDFLEVHEDFWNVGGLMKKMFDRLDQGIAIVAIQKTNKESDHGLGGLRGLEKPRLYLSLKNGENYHTCKIVKCKSAREPEALNPNGLELDFKLVRGCLFVPTNPIIRSNGEKRFWKRPAEAAMLRKREEIPTDESNPFY